MNTDIIGGNVTRSETEERIGTLIVVEPSAVIPPAITARLRGSTATLQRSVNQSTANFLRQIVLQEKKFQLSDHRLSEAFFLIGTEFDRHAALRTIISRTLINSQQTQRRTLKLIATRTSPEASQHLFALMDELISVCQVRARVELEFMVQEVSNIDSKRVLPLRPDASTNSDRLTFVA